MKIIEGYRANTENGTLIFADEDSAYDVEPYSVVYGLWLVGEPNSAGFYSGVTDLSRDKVTFVHYSETEKTFFITESQMKGSQAREFIGGRISLNNHLAIVDQLVEMGFRQILI